LDREDRGRHLDRGGANARKGADVKGKDLEQARNRSKSLIVVEGTRRHWGKCCDKKGPGVKQNGIIFEGGDRAVCECD